MTVSSTIKSIYTLLLPSLVSTFSAHEYEDQGCQRANSSFPSVYSDFVSSRLHFVLHELWTHCTYKWRKWQTNLCIIFFLTTFFYNVGPLGLTGREPARQTNEPSLNPSRDATVHPVYETFNVMCVV